MIYIEEDALELERMSRQMAERAVMLRNLLEETEAMRDEMHTQAVMVRAALNVQNN